MNVYRGGCWLGRQGAGGGGGTSTYNEVGGDAPVVVDDGEVERQNEALHPLSLLRAEQVPLLHRSLHDRTQAERDVLLPANRGQH